MDLEQARRASLEDEEIRYRWALEMVVGESSSRSKSTMMVQLLDMWAILMVA